MKSTTMSKLTTSRTFIYSLICVILFIGLIKWSHMLLKNDYIMECFGVQNDKTTNNVNLPLTTTYSCKNMCGPYARCSITGDQCLSDIDCFGCKPSTSEISRSFLKTNNVVPDDDAGKYAFISPNYSTLTTGIGRRAKLITDNKYSRPPNYNTGVNMWRPLFNEGQELYNNTYKSPPDLQFKPKYPTRYTLSGQFVEHGALAANGYLDT
jgi:hypothetical protein